MDLTIQTWIDTLRSNTHPQTMGVLCDGAGMCTLGVYAHLRGYTIDQMIDDFDPIYLQLKKELPYTIFYEAIRLNDAGHTFPEIADKLEELANAAA